MCSVQWIVPERLRQPVRLPRPPPATGWPQNPCSKEVPLRRVFHVDCFSFVLFTFRDEAHHKTSIRPFISSTGSLLLNFSRIFLRRWIDIQHILQYPINGTGIAAGQVGFYPAPVKNGCFVLFFYRNGVMCVQTLRNGSRLQKALNESPTMFRRFAAAIRVYPFCEHAANFQACAKGSWAGLSGTGGAGKTERAS